MTTPVGAIPTSPIGSLPGTQPATPSSTGSNSLGQDAFLKLLVAQLKYQDPMKPQDSSQFMAQTAQFTSLSKLTNIDATNTAMLGAQGFLQAAALVGRSVTYTTADGTEATGIVDSASFGPDGPTLRIGDKDVPIAEVTKIAPGTTG
jgi:flagellar basal-body rod modification protein FlgD